ncbi:hypothetical protein B0H10DRAFT_2188003 [Mycena sp. CBHHK59/15]|nr:hypothetical protein B0H10DRAFT_2188003 [Mycena sp. CBHHK59/15]
MLGFLVFTVFTSISAAGCVYYGLFCFIGIALGREQCCNACELNVPFDQARSSEVINAAVKLISWYSLENWFIHSPNPLIPHDVNIRSLLEGRQCVESGSDGHTLFAAQCTESFSYNLPFSISTLATTPFDAIAYPTFLVNYDFPNQDRAGLEEYFERIDVQVRPYDDARILTIDGVDASKYLVDLAPESSIYKGLVGAYETVNLRYMRLMSHYSADTDAGLFTQEVGLFAQRTSYPGADSINLTLQTAQEVINLTVPWAATFLSIGNTTETWTESVHKVEDVPVPIAHRAVIRPTSQIPVRAANGNTKLASSVNVVQPTLKSFGHFVTLDIYQLADHPKVGVVYFELFEPTDGTFSTRYYNGISATLFTGLTALKDAGVEYILIDISGNRGGFINAGAIAIWSLWPQDLYPGFPSVFRDSDISRREAVLVWWIPRSSNGIFLPEQQPVYGSARSNDASSHPFFDDFGTASDVTNFTTPPFEGKDYLSLPEAWGPLCGLWWNTGFHDLEFNGGVKGSEITFFGDILFQLEMLNMLDDPAAPRYLPINAQFSINYRNAIPYIDTQDGILEYVWEGATKKYQFTHAQLNNPQKSGSSLPKSFSDKISS